MKAVFLNGSMLHFIRLLISTRYYEKRRLIHAVYLFWKQTSLKTTQGSLS